MMSFAPKIPIDLIPIAKKICDDTKRTSFFRGEEDVVDIVTFDLIGLLPTKGIREFMRKIMFNVNRKIAQIMQSI